METHTMSSLPDYEPTSDDLRDLETLRRQEQAETQQSTAVTCHNSIRLGPVTLAIRAAIVKHEDELRRLRAMLDWSWWQRYRHQVTAHEIRRCIKANEDRVSVLRDAEDIAITVERWAIEP